MQGLTPSEKKGVIVIVIVITLASIIRLVKPFVYNPDTFDYSASDSIFTRISLSKYVDIQHNSDEKTKSTKEKQKALPLSSIDINKANKSELQKLPRIGPAIAQRIIDYRSIHGKFSSHGDLKKIKGIGIKTLDNIRPYLKPIGK